MIMCQEEVKKSLTCQVAKQEKNERLIEPEFGRTIYCNKFSRIGSAGQLSFYAISCSIKQAQGMVSTAPV